MLAPYTMTVGLFRGINPKQKNMKNHNFAPWNLALRRSHSWRTIFVLILIIRELLCVFMPFREVSTVTVIDTIRNRTNACVVHACMHACVCVCVCVCVHACACAYTYIHARMHSMCVLQLNRTEVGFLQTVTVCPFHSSKRPDMTFAVNWALKTNYLSINSSKSQQADDTLVTEGRGCRT